MAQQLPRGGSTGKKPVKQTLKKSTKTVQQIGAESKAVVPRSSRTASVHQDDKTMIAPPGYTARRIQPAKNYDVISFARAMNDDFGPQVKKLFDGEREAAIEAQETDIYIGWQCPEYKWDCQRIGKSSYCFCGHMLAEHSKYTGTSVRVPCQQPGCACKAFSWVPSRPEDVGEFWLPKRRDFDPATWRMNCRCKHTHEEHDPNGQHRCRRCGCSVFTSSSVCAACDRHWEEHETFFDSSATRREKGMPYGADYLPFAEIPSLRNMVLTGEDDGNMEYMRLQENHLRPSTKALPSSEHRANEPRSAQRNNNSSASDGFGSRFHPVYD